jgi:hypothetical protein
MSNRIIKRGPPKPPTVWKPVKFRHFLQFIDDLDVLVEYFDQLQTTSHTIRAGGHIPEVEEVNCDHNDYEELIERCRESMRRYDRDGDDDQRYDQDDDLTFEHASKRLALMMDAWSNTSKFEDDDAAARFGETMVQHVLAQEPSAAVLESACRRLIDEGKPYTPQTGEVVRAIKAEIDAWRPRKWALRNVDHVYQEIIDAIPKAKAAAEKRKIEAATAAARRKIEAEADAACKEAQAEEERWKAEEEYEAMRRCSGRTYYAQHVALQAALKEIKSSYARDMHVVSCAIGLFDERRKLRAWEREAECEALRRRDDEAFSQYAYSAGENDALNSSSTLEGLLEDNAANYSRAESYLVSYALGVFEMRRELRAWRQAWARSKYGIPIWS